MKRPDPFTGPAPGDRSAAARAGFRRQIAYLVVTGVVTVAATLFYLHASGSMSPTLVVTSVLGVFVSIVLGGGLMAMGFYSANSGIDDTVAAARPEADTE